MTCAYMDAELLYLTQCINDLEQAQARIYQVVSHLKETRQEIIEAKARTGGRPQ